MERLHPTDQTPAQPMPEHHAQCNEWSIRCRLEFQLEVARRMMDVEHLGDAEMAEWTTSHAAQFAAIVDAKDDDGAAIRRLIVTDPEAAYAQVLRRMLH